MDDPALSGGPWFLFVTDPWSTLDHPRDTTLRLIEEAHNLGIGCAWADVRTVRWEDSAGRLCAHEVTAVDPARDARSFRLASLGTRRVSDFDVVLYRPDPPVDLAYLHPLQLVSADLELRASERCRRVELVNCARVLLSHSEKLLAFRGSSLMPPTVVATRYEDLSRFGEKEGCTIAKPYHLCQSKDVELIEWTTQAARDRSRCVLARLTDNFVRPAVLQRFLPGILDGETRVWMLDGEPIATACKKSAEGSYRIDMDKGGVLLPHVPTEAELRTVSAVGAWLRQEGVRLAAVDLIDGWVTDLNFTSPGLLAGMEAIAGRNLARPIVRALAGPMPCVSRTSAGELAQSPAA
jgi:glutathione synthase